MFGPDGIDSGTEGIAPPERGYTCRKRGSAARYLQYPVRKLSSITSWPAPSLSMPPKTEGHTEGEAVRQIMVFVMRCAASTGELSGSASDGPIEIECLQALDMDLSSPIDRKDLGHNPFARDAVIGPTPTIEGSNGGGALGD